jgi:hypothetical protein
VYRIKASTFLDEDDDSTRRFLAAALAPKTNTFAGTSTEERLQNEVLLVREKQRPPTVFQRYAQQNLLSVQAVRTTAKGSEEAELGRQEALLLSKRIRIPFLYLRRKLLIRFAHTTKIKEIQQLLLLPSQPENQRNNC